MDDDEYINVTARLVLQENLIRNILVMIYANKPAAFEQAKLAELQATFRSMSVAEGAPSDAPLLEVQSEVLRQLEQFWRALRADIEATRAGPG